MRLDLDEGKMICPECIKGKKLHKEVQQEQHKKESSAFAPNQMNAPAEQRPSRIGHKCASCGYKFMIDPETRKPKTCPYCNNRVMSF